MQASVGNVNISDYQHHHSYHLSLQNNLSNSTENTSFARDRTKLANIHLAARHPRNKLNTTTDKYATDAVSAHKLNTRNICWSPVCRRAVCENVSLQQCRQHEAHLNSSQHSRCSSPSILPDLVCKTHRASVQREVTMTTESSINSAITLSQMNSLDMQDT